MNLVTKFLVLLLCGQLLFILPVSANCTNSVTKEKKGNNSTPVDTSEDDFSDEISHLEIVIQDLEDVSDLIDEGDKKTALKILKSAQKEIRKVEEFDAIDKSDFSKTIKKIISFVKKGDNESALDLIDEILIDLDDFVVEEEDEEEDSEDDEFFF